jgi:hypothetical protein
MGSFNRESLIEAWLQFVEGDERQLWAMVELLELAETDPQETLAIILDIIDRAPSEYAIGQLTAGPLERLVSANGRQIIDSIETASSTVPQLSHMLQGIYRINVPQDVWERVVAISARVRQMQVRERDD